jgi:hypothetical protein
MTEIKLTILAKKSDNKAFKGSDGNWYNLNAPVIPYLEKMNKGDEVVVEFEKKGVSRYVSKLVSASAARVEAPVEEKKKSSTGYACEVCGKELKNGKFKKCYTCNKSGATKKEDSKSTPTEVKKEYKSNYGSPEDIAGKEIGCVLGAAATVAGGCGFKDPEVAAQFVKTLAESLLDWMRAKK